MSSNDSVSIDKIDEIRNSEKNHVEWDGFYMKGGSGNDKYMLSGKDVLPHPKHQQDASSKLINVNLRVGFGIKKYQFLEIKDETIEDSEIVSDTFISLERAR